jgi:hypothetical protein
MEVCEKSSCGNQNVHYRVISKPLLELQQVKMQSKGITKLWGLCLEANKVGRLGCVEEIAHSLAEVFLDICYAITNTKEDFQSSERHEE